MSWAPDQAEAEAIAYEQWRSNVFAPPVCWDLETAEHFDVVSEDVPLEKVNAGRERLRRPRAGTSAGWRSTVELGFDQISLHHVGQEQDAFIDAFGAKVLPKLRSAGV